MLHKAFFKDRVGQPFDVGVKVRSWEADVEAFQDFQLFDRDLPEVRAAASTLDFRNARSGLIRLALVDAFDARHDLLNSLREGLHSAFLLFLGLIGGLDAGHDGFDATRLKLKIKLGDLLLGLFVEGSHWVSPVRLK